MALDRAQLVAWIEKTRKTQRRLGVVVGVGAAVGVALLVWRGALGAVVLAIVGIVALCGFWITTGHLTDWHAKLDAIDRPRAKTRARYER